jgi:hypothetical protein
VTGSIAAERSSAVPAFAGWPQWVHSHDLIAFHRMVGFGAERKLILKAAPSGFSPLPTSRLPIVHADIAYRVCGAGKGLFPHEDF